tara:strand:- start:24 stop:1049 length:1026 start_codon:yes stop_codon:yes gene_type:complete
MAQIDKPNLHFNTKLYTGNGSVTTQTGVGFQPDMVWIKDRSGTNNHEITDAVRGANYQIYTNLTNAQTNSSGHLTAFTSDGFSLGTDGSINTNSSDYASWNWKANGAGSSNTDGSVTSTVSANQTAGFSIVKYTGAYSTGTVGHGLNATPKIVLYKNLTDVTYWYFTTTAIDGSNDLLLLPSNDGSTAFSAPVPTNSVLNLIANNDTNGSGDNIIAYCFAEKRGYSRFGSYTGNGNADGPVIYTGFKPAFVIIKRYNTSGNFWHLYDNKRSSSGGSNVINFVLYPQNNHAGYVGDKLDFLSNGIKIRSANTDMNASGGGYFYMAFAENPIVGSNNIPATAR